MKSKNPGFIPGDHWVECSRCGINFRKSEMTTDGQSQGLIVCKECRDPRHPQEMVRAIADKLSAKGLVNPESADSFLPTCSRCAEAGVAIAGCAVAGRDCPSVPASTF